MRAPIYRNLDRPLQVLGLYPFQMIILGLTLVVGDEVARALSAARLWPAAGFMVLAFSFFVFNRTLGPLFPRRLVRFVGFPDRLFRCIYRRGKGRP